VRKSLFKIHPSSSSTTPNTPTTNSLKSYTIAHPYGTTRINFCANCGSTVYRDSEDPSFAGLDLVLVQGTTLDALEQWEWERASEELGKFEAAAAAAATVSPESSEGDVEAEAEVEASSAERGLFAGVSAGSATAAAAPEWQGCGCGCC